MFLKGSNIIIKEKVWEASFSILSIFYSFYSLFICIIIEFWKYVFSIDDQHLNMIWFQGPPWLHSFFKKSYNSKKAAISLKGL